MKNKLLGILVCMLLIATAVFPVAGTMNINNTKIEIKKATSDTSLSDLNLCQPSNDIWLELNTGTISPGVLCPYYTVDPDWKVTSSDVISIINTQAYVIDMDYISGARWITPHHDNWASTDFPNGNYSFEIKFTLDTRCHGDFVLAFDYMVDDCADFYLNDILIGTGAWYVLQSVLVTNQNLFKRGENILRANISQRGSGPMGLILRGNVTGKSKPCNDLWVELNTGTISPGVLGKDGENDPDWKLTRSSVISPIKYPQAYITPMPGCVSSYLAKWIKPNPANHPESSYTPVGDHSFETKFNLDISTHENFVLTFEYAVDDTIDFYLNGNPIETGGGWSQWTGPIVITSQQFPQLFLDGTNTLKAVLHQLAPVPSGFIFIGNVTGKCKCTPPPYPMVSWWPADGNDKDIAGPNDGVWEVNGQPWPSSYQDGMVDQAFRFSGLGGAYVIADDDPTLNFHEGDFSVDAWIKTPNNPDWSQYTQSIVDKRDMNTPNERGYWLYLDNGYIGALCFRIATDKSGAPNVWTFCSNKIITDGNWHHVAVTIDRISSSTAQVILYVDGSAESYLADISGDVTNAGDLRIGKEQLDGCGHVTFQGSIDEVEIFNRCLTSTEIEKIYCAGSGGKCKPVPIDPIINGIYDGKVGEEYTYTLVSTDPNGKDISYYVDWGDETFEDWFGPYASGETATAKHTWSEQGTYTIKAKAKNTDGAESEWTELEVSMPKSKSINTMPLFLQFLENFPIIYQLLQRLLML